MIRSALLAAAAIASLAVPMSAAAATGSGDPAFDAYRSICVANMGEYVAVLRAADAAGWQNSSVSPPVDAAISVTDQAAREMSVGGENLTLLINRGLQHMRAGDVPVGVCRIETSKPDPGAIDLSKSWLGFAPDGGDSTLAYFFVTPAADTPQHVAANAPMPPGGVSIVKVQLDPNSTIFLYQHFAK
jgi:hypothetical protein